MSGWGDIESTIPLAPAASFTAGASSKGPTSNKRARDESTHSPAARATSTNRHKSVGAAIADLPHLVQSLLQQIFAEGHVKPSELFGGPSLVRELMAFDEDGACTILHRYRSKDPSTVRHHDGFLRSVVRRYQAEVGSTAAILDDGGDGDGRASVGKSTKKMKVTPP